jgi:transposase
LLKLEILRISWDEAFNIMHKAVVRGQSRKQDKTLEYVGVYEKAFKKAHSYLTVVSDLKQKIVEYIGMDRKKESLTGYFESLTQQQKDSIMAVSMDMWNPFIKATQDTIEDAQTKIVFDKFHIMANMSKALDQVRRDENRALFKEGNDTLIGSKYLWLYANENIPTKHKQRFKNKPCLGNKRKSKSLMGL